MVEGVAVSVAEEEFASACAAEQCTRSRTRFGLRVVRRDDLTRIRFHRPQCTKRLHTRSLCHEGLLHG